MVFFVCEGCNESLKKNQVDKHAARCHSCWAVTCVDCNVTFPEDEYRAHISCVSEAERYQGALYRGPKHAAAGKKKSPQDLWVEVVEVAASDPSVAPPALRSFVEQLSGFGNVPRNQKKFGNFAKNSLKVRSDATIAELWDFLSQQQQAAQQAQQAEAATGEGGESNASTSAKADKGETAGGGGRIHEAKEEEKEENAEKKGGKEKKKKRAAADDSKAAATKRGRGNGDAEPGPAVAAAWAKAIKTALKAAPGRALPARSLRKAAAKVADEATKPRDKAFQKAAFEAGLALVAKASCSGAGKDSVVTYRS